HLPAPARRAVGISAKHTGSIASDAGWAAWRAAARPLAASTSSGGDNPTRDKQPLGRTGPPTSALPPYLHGVPSPVGHSTRQSRTRLNRPNRYHPDARPQRPSDGCTFGALTIGRFPFPTPSRVGRDSRDLTSIQANPYSLTTRYWIVRLAIACRSNQRR